ncbi:hypothetical protein EHQ16_14390 [Leptospira kanakyensis]|uniref:Lipoprotein n=1 Tax=Leptospira kanakyensis TaxID=2484968 RepID=A0A6N4QEQ4_9LEPT|nr:hypothetical protein [Leptospira kanakyensis]TGK52022.1 hypothetical protein EHQ11_07985 [Leptospira kanakyensis]TGK57069.1 hypothetical protein EHQ16_14390 [Leptospira kanakyensis]TGK71914.1 hypothetical protein EHQ18_08085 [Leptospira kanakyensis]
MSKKNILYLSAFLFFIGCTNVYSPMGIKGKKAKEQLEELRSGLSAVSLFTYIPATLNITSNSTNTTYTCATENTAISGFTNPTTGANFDLSSPINYIDLSVTAGGTHYFRSSPSSTNQIITGKILKTNDTSPTASCSYITGSVCGNTDLSGVSISSSISTMMSVSAGNCLAILCTTPAYIRLKQYNFELFSLAGLEPILSSTSSPYIFESVSKIGEDTYYTKESFEKCRKEIVDYAVIEIQYSKFLSALITEVSTCNKPHSLFQGAASSASKLTAAIQGNACDLEPVNFFGF